MIPENTPVVSNDVAVQDGGAAPGLPSNDPTYWFGLIAEAEAARFLGFGVRALQTWRVNGNSPKFIKINGRCVRYRRVDLRDWADARVRTSTADTGPEATTRDAKAAS